MSWRFHPASFAAGVQSAGAGASAGGARAAMANHVSTTLGSGPRLSGWRSNASVPVPPSTWELAFRLGIGSGALTVSSNGIRIAQSALQDLITNNGLDMLSPVRVLRFEKASDANVYAECWLGQALGGDDAIISGQVPVGTGISLVAGGLAIDWNPAVDGVAPPDPGGGTSGTISDGDSRLDWELDARKYFSAQSYVGLVQSMVFPNTAWSAIGNSGIQFTPAGGGSFVTAVNTKVADPDNGSRYAVLHHIRSTMPHWAGDDLLGQSATYRAETIATEQATDPGSIYYGRAYWYALSFRLGSDFTDGSIGNSIADFHAQGMVDVNGNSTRGPSPISYIVQPEDDGSGGRRIRLAIWRTWSTGTGYRWDTVSIIVPVTTWVHVVGRCKPHWDVAVGPYHEVWIATGTSGTQTKVASWVGVPIGFNDNSTYLFAKLGLYRFDAWSGDPSSSRTMHTKGFRLWRDEPTTTNPLNAANLLAYQRTL